MEVTRRTALGLMAPLLEAQAADPGAGVEVGWLGGALPLVESGVSWGVPWPRGAVHKDQSFTLAADGKPLPLESWPLAYWPDGSMKFTGFATVASPGTAGAVQIQAYQA